MSQSDSTRTDEALTRLSRLLADAAQRGTLDVDGSSELRDAVLAAGPTRAPVDATLAAAWRTASHGFRVHGLRDALEDLMLGSALVGVLLDSAELDEANAAEGGAAAVARRDEEASANAALWVLREAADDPLDPIGWKRVCAIVRAGRQRAVPDLEAALLVAERGPAASFATLALTAFRDGPEDATDRLTSLVALGRFADPRIPAWLDGVVRSGAAGMEAVQALSHVAARVHAAGDEAGLEQVLGALLAAVPIDDVTARSDGWVRWLALDLLSRLVGVAAVPMLQASFAAGGQYDVPWFLPQVKARVESLGAACPAPEGTTLPHVPALADLATNVHSRSPRIARRAAVLAAEQPDLSAALRSRAAVERALVARGQLLGSFLDADGVSPATLDASFTPWCEVLSDEDRAALVKAEEAWLG